MKDTDVVKEHLDGLLDQFADDITRYLMGKYGLAENDGGESSPSPN